VGGASIQDLPPEILVEITKNTEYNDAKSFLLTSKTIGAAFTHESISAVIRRINYSTLLAIKDENRRNYLNVTIQHLSMNPSFDPIYIASLYGNVKAIRAMLLSRDPSEDLSYALRVATHYGHTEIVRVLLKDKRVDPTAFDNAALFSSSTLVLSDYCSKTQESIRQYTNKLLLPW
jgi:hypothetical protein